MCLNSSLRLSLHQGGNPARRRPRVERERSGSEQTETCWRSDPDHAERPRGFLPHRIRHRRHGWANTQTRTCMQTLQHARMHTDSHEAFISLETYCFPCLIPVGKTNREDDFVFLFWDKAWIISHICHQYRSHVSLTKIPRSKDQKSNIWQYKHISLI